MTPEEAGAALKQALDAVNYHARAIVSAQAAVDGTTAKVAKYVTLVAGVKADQAEAVKQLAAEQAAEQAARDSLATIQAQAAQLGVHAPAGTNVTAFAETATGSGEAKV